MSVTFKIKQYEQKIKHNNDIKNNDIENNFILNIDKNIIKEIEIYKLEVSKLNDRTKIDDTTIDNLANNIKTNGLINPLTVIFNNDTQKYEIIAGQRRFLAIKKLNHKKILCNIIKKDTSAEKQQILSLMDNLHQPEMKLSERIKMIAKLKNNGYTDIQISELVNESENIVKKYINVSILPDNILDRLDEKHSNKISLSFVCDLVGIVEGKEFSTEEYIIILNELDTLDTKYKNKFLHRIKINIENVLSCSEYKIDNLIDYIKQQKSSYVYNMENINKEKKQIKLTNDINNMIDKIKNMDNYKDIFINIAKFEEIKKEYLNNEKTKKEAMKVIINIFNNNKKETEKDYSILHETWEKIDKKITEEIKKNNRSIYVKNRTILNPILEEYFYAGVAERFHKQCIVSNYDIEICDACHIIPLEESHTFDINNGLFLNCILHKLFNKHYWSINPHTLCIEISQNYKNDILEKYDKKELLFLKHYDLTIKNLEHHYEIFKKNTVTKLSQ